MEQLNKLFSQEILLQFQTKPFNLHHFRHQDSHLRSLQHYFLRNISFGSAFLRFF